MAEVKPRNEAVPVFVDCPECGYENTFGGICDEEGYVVEHFGRRCQGGREDPDTLQVIACAFRFRFKVCESCGAENDIAARNCSDCGAVIVDPDKKLKDAMELKDAHIMRPYQMVFEKSKDKKGRDRLTVTYMDTDSNPLREFYLMHEPSHRKAFYHNFVRKHARLPGLQNEVASIDQLMGREFEYRTPTFIIARKKNYYWRISEKIF